MKVLHVIPSVSPSLGGPTHVVLNLVKALITKGIDAEIVTTNDDRDDVLDVPTRQRVIHKGVPVWFLPRFSPPLKEFIFSPALFQWLWKNAPDYDVIHSHYLFSFAPTCAGITARQNDVPYIVRPLGQLSPWALKQSQTKKRIYSFLFEEHNLRSAAAIHCTSTGEVEDVKKIGIQTSTATIPLGVDVPAVIPDATRQLYQVYEIPNGRFTLLFLSRIHYKKRPELLLQVVHQLVYRGKDIHLLLAGTGEKDYIGKLKDLVSSLNLNGRVTFTGFVQGRDKDLLLQGVNAFVLPSFSENFGVAVAEALVSGLPVITTPGVQISPEIASAKAGLIVEGEEDYLSQAIEKLMSDPELQKEFSKNGKKLAQQRYSWDVIAEQLINVYEIVIENHCLPKDIVF
ncbi:glycosyltransferase [Leptothoe spongobia]|uniref:Glycosyltransferase n=1 Tax=Leptothoe spongobia TAU-MAC 1115 TaxID=1967444 RepID=A0A947DCN2_9CYAN|nr:glycosyltransferase [Leptothoe spongobia]MBT9314580.1 glycosyltransferase [Leptothoe spongobia TAU-MAC 1115]